eukprot:GHRQ01036445.1.p2 GENE.GHRQ01036445.1~~GHRQ01036445.1.p2  ORF type:complete len:119 (+),score=21.01 GHRQ01036445.1:446-802(+)
MGIESMCSTHITMVVKGADDHSLGLRCRFNIPHINAGDLLYSEVASKTPLGLEAKQYMDSSKTVPDHMLLTLLLRRLAAPDCQVQGWALDGFPHTRKQVRLARISCCLLLCTHTMIAE